MNLFNAMQDCIVGGFELNPTYRFNSNPSAVQFAVERYDSAHKFEFEQNPKVSLLNLRRSLRCVIQIAYGIST